MPKITLEGAALVGVVVAVIASLFYAMGTAAHLSYFNALDFDAHQFPTLGAELHLVGMVHAVLSALFVGLFVLVYVCVFVLSDRAEDWLSRHPTPAKWRIPLGLLMMAVSAGMIYFGPQVTLRQWIGAGIIVGTIFLAVFLLGKWVSPVVMGCVIGGVIIVPGVIQYVSGKAYEAGKARAVEAGKSGATTIIEFADGSTRTAPGDRIVCSESLCGFHDGERATVISLEGVRCIQSPVPQEQPRHTLCFSK